MNTRYLRTKRDRSHIAIQKDLRKLGYSVVDLSSVGNGVSDLLVSNGPHTVLIELKELGGDFYLEQLAFASEWKGHIAFAKNVNECVSIVEFPERYCLTREHRARIDQIVTQYRAKTKDKLPRISVTRFDALMG